MWWRVLAILVVCLLAYAEEDIEIFSEPFVIERHSADGGMPADEELRNIWDPQADDETDNGFYLKMDMAGDYKVTWWEPDLIDAVSNGTDMGQILWWDHPNTNWTISTTPDINEVPIWVGTNIVWTNLVEAALPDGTNDGDMLWYDLPTTSWVITAEGPGTDQVPYWTGDEILWTNLLDLTNGTADGQLLWWDESNGQLWALSETPDTNQVPYWDGAIIAWTNITDLLTNGVCIGQILWWNHPEERWEPSYDCPDTNDIPLWDGSTMTWTNGMFLPEGDANGQILYWNAVDSKWEITEAPSADEFAHWTGTEMLWHPAYQVKVDDAANADYLGADRLSGAIRTDDSINYLDGGDWIQLSVDLTNQPPDTGGLFGLYNFGTNTVSVYGGPQNDEKFDYAALDWLAVAGVDTPITISAAAYLYVEWDLVTQSASVEQNPTWPPTAQDDHEYFPLWYVPVSTGGVIEAESVFDLRNAIEDEVPNGKADGQVLYWLDSDHDDTPGGQYQPSAYPSEDSIYWWDESAKKIQVLAHPGVDALLRADKDGGFSWLEAGSVEYKVVQVQGTGTNIEFVVDWVRGHE